MHPAIFGMIGVLLIGLSTMMRRLTRSAMSPMRRDAWLRLLALGVAMVGLAIYHVARGDS